MNKNNVISKKKKSPTKPIKVIVVNEPSPEAIKNVAIFLKSLVK